MSDRYLDEDESFSATVMMRRDVEKRYCFKEKPLWVNLLIA